MDMKGWDTNPLVLPLFGWIPVKNKSPAVKQTNVPSKMAANSKQKLLTVSVGYRNKRMRKLTFFPLTIQKMLHAKYR